MRSPSASTTRLAVPALVDHRVLMTGFATPEEAAFDATIPSRFQRVLGVTIDGDRAVVFTLTNEHPYFEEYSVYCEREQGRWFDTHGSSGWDNPPPEVVEAARSLSYEY